jgi:hypothetical protein
VRYFNQFLHNLENNILIIFKGIEANYFYVYQTNFILKISHMKACGTKRQVPTQ